MNPEIAWREYVAVLEAMPGIIESHGPLTIEQRKALAPLLTMLRERAFPSSATSEKAA